MLAVDIYPLSWVRFWLAVVLIMGFAPIYLKRVLEAHRGVAISAEGCGANLAQAQVVYRVLPGDSAMSLTGAVWSNLSINERISLLKAAYPQRSPALLAFEANKTWNYLLPSTKSDLNNVDWSLTIGRDVAETESCERIAQLENQVKSLDYGLGSVNKQYESAIAEINGLRESLREVRAVMQEMDSLVHFASKREIESPSNHQEFAREAEERLSRWNKVIAKSRATLDAAKEKES